MQTRAGYTLIELWCVLCLVALLAATLAPSLAHGRRVLAVRAAAGELTGLIAAARAAAILGGGAALTVDAAEGAAWIERADGTRGARHEVAARHGVRLVTDRPGAMSIRYDALGIGRMSSGSIGIRSGDAHTTLTISAYGRVRQ